MTLAPASKKEPLWLWVILFSDPDLHWFHMKFQASENFILFSISVWCTLMRQLGQQSWFRFTWVQARRFSDIWVHAAERGNPNLPPYSFLPFYTIPAVLQPYVEKQGSLLYSAASSTTPPVILLDLSSSPLCWALITSLHDRNSFPNSDSVVFSYLHEVCPLSLEVWIVFYCTSWHPPV